MRPGPTARLGAALLILVAALCGNARGDAPASGWTLAGRLGVMQFIIVPEESARDPAYYESVIRQICGADGATCFVHFFTNTQHVQVRMPLPDEIYAESAARFQRSAKQGREQFMFNCRLKIPEQECF